MPPSEVAVIFRQKLESEKTFCSWTSRLFRSTAWKHDDLFLYLIFNQRPVDDRMPCRLREAMSTALVCILCIPSVSRFCKIDVKAYNQNEL